MIRRAISILDWYLVGPDVPAGQSTTRFYTSKLYISVGPRSAAAILRHTGTQWTPHTHP